MYVCMYVYVLVLGKHFLILTIRKYYMFYGFIVDRNLFTRVLYCIYIYVYLCVFSLRIVGTLVAYSNFGPRLYFLRVLYILCLHYIISTAVTVSVEY